MFMKVITVGVIAAYHIMVVGRAVCAVIFLAVGTLYLIAAYEAAQEIAEDNWATFSQESETICTTAPC